VLAGAVYRLLTDARFYRVVSHEWLPRTAYNVAPKQMSAKLTGLSLVFTLLMVACGTSTTPASKQAPASGGGSASLYSAAKAEGQVIVVAPFNGEITNKLVSAFELKYPGVKVNITNLTAGQTVERIVTEGAANRTSLDVSQAPLDSISPLTDRNLLASIEWPSITDGASADGIFQDGLGVDYYQLPTVLAYNTDLMQPAQAPKQWQDLLKPDFRGGRMLLDSRGHFMDQLGFVWSEDRMVQFAKDLKAQQPLLIPRMSDGVQRMAAGEAPLASINLADYILYTGRGAHLQLAGVSPIQASNFVLYVLKSAPHPNAARLWAAWAASTEGRALLEKAGGPAMLTKDSGSKTAQLLSAAHLDAWSATTTKDAATESDYQAELQKIFTA
jgi:iron(III) transport system substrate-binding protein